jgi:hypothetical protein
VLFGFQEGFFLSLSLFIYFFFVILGFELRALGLLGGCSTTSATPPALGFLSFGPGLSSDHKSTYLCLFHSWDHRHVATTSTLLIEMGISLPFCLGGSQTIIFLISPSFRSWDYKSVLPCPACNNYFNLMTLIDSGPRLTLLSFSYLTILTV